MTEMNRQYAFESLFPYLESVQICRGVSGWLRIKDIIGRGSSSVPLRLYSRTYFNLHAIFPQLSDPADGSRDLREKLSRQLYHHTPAIAGTRDKECTSRLVDSLSAAEWRELTSARKIDNKTAFTFIESARSGLSKLIRAVKPGSSLLEDLLLEAMVTRKSKQVARFLEAWETAKMCYEGVPPYQVRLTEVVLRTLQSLDPGYHLTGPQGQFPQLSPAHSKWVTHCIDSGSQHLPKVFTSETCRTLKSVIEEKQKVQ